MIEKKKKKFKTQEGKAVRKDVGRTNKEVERWMIDGCTKNDEGSTCVEDVDRLH